jgi:hypothetical protein
MQNRKWKQSHLITHTKQCISNTNRPTGSLEMYVFSLESFSIFYFFIQAMFEVIFISLLASMLSIKSNLKLTKSTIKWTESGGSLFVPQVHFLREIGPVWERSKPSSNHVPEWTSHTPLTTNAETYRRQRKYLCLERPTQTRPVAGAQPSANCFRTYFHPQNQQRDVESAAHLGWSLAFTQRVGERLTL